MSLQSFIAQFREKLKADYIEAFKAGTLTQDEIEDPDIWYEEELRVYQSNPSIYLSEDNETTLL